VVGAERRVRRGPAVRGRPDRRVEELVVGHGAQVPRQTERFRQFMEGVRQRERDTLTAGPFADDAANLEANFRRLN